MPLPSPLISVAELAARLAEPSPTEPLRIVDCRWYLGRPGDGRAAYDAGHLPGAIHLDIDGDLADPASVGPGRHPLPDPPRFAAVASAAGIGDEHLVVAYDDAGGWVAARLWWMLENLGHQAVVVLDGGIGAWIAAGLPLTTDVPAWPPGRLRLRTSWRRTIDRDALRARLGAVTLLDARAPARYRGEVEPIDPIAGHIPTAINAPTDANLAPDGRFLPADTLAERYRLLGADRPAGEVVTSCGSGVSATHDALAMRLAGLADPLLYPGSYSDWTRSGLPVRTGEEPGDPA